MKSLNAKKLEKILDNVEMFRILSNHDLIAIKRAISILKRQGFVTNSEKRQVKDALDCLLGVVIDKPIGSNIEKLVDIFVNLVSDWGEDPEIQEKVSIIKRFASYHLTAIDAIKVLKKLLRRTELMQNFSSPSFELSKYYLQSLNDTKSSKKGQKRKNK